MSWRASILAGLLRPWLGSLRIRRFGRARVQGLLDEGTPFLYALWHGDQVLLLGTHRHDPCTVLVSLSRDGALLAGVLLRLGYQVVRGSTSRGAVGGWLGLRRALARGRAPTFAVDGPRGPAGSVAAGVLALARTSGASIVPVAASSSRALRLSSWDRTKLPWPGARAAVVYGRPLRVGPSEDLESARSELTRRLLLASRRSERACR